MRRPVTSVHRGVAILVALASTLLLVSHASAHVSVVPERIEASSPVTLTFVAPGEHELSMVAFRVTVPDGATVIDGSERGWRFAVEKGTAVWSGGRVAPYGTASFRLRVAAPERAGDHQLVATQRYADGHTDRWKVRLTVVSPSPEQHLLAGIVAGAIGLSLVVAVVFWRVRSR
jgi:hypothetical protein